ERSPDGDHDGQSNARPRDRRRHVHHSLHRAGLRCVMRAFWTVVVALTLAAPARGQDGAAPASPSEANVFERLVVTGAVRAGYWSSTRNLDSEQNIGAGMLWLKTSHKVSDRVSFLAEGWTALRGPLEYGDATGELREAFVDLRFGRLDVRAGRQIIAWGRADGGNP